MLQSILVYSLIMGVMILFGIKESNQKTIYFTSLGKVKILPFFKFGTMFPLLLFALIFGMRYDVGVDYLNYLDIYEGHDIPIRYEPLFKYITLFCKELKLHFSVYFALIALIQVFFFFYAFEREKYIFPFLVFFLFTNGDWMFWMNGIRQAIAMCIWIYSIKYIENKNFKLYLFWIVIACLFHRSAIILIIFYPILRNNCDFFKSIQIQLVLLVFAFVIRLFFLDVVVHFSAFVDFYQSLFKGMNLYTGYNIDRLMETYVNREGTGLAFLFKIIINILIIFYSTRLKTFYNSRRFNILYFFYFIGLITFYLFPTGFVIFTRPFRYFYIFQCIMFAYFAYYLYSIKTKDNNIFYPILIISFLSIFYLNLLTATDKAHLWYQFYFQI